MLRFLSKIWRAISPHARLAWDVWLRDIATDHVRSFLVKNPTIDDWAFFLDQNVRSIREITGIKNEFVIERILRSVVQELGILPKQSKEKG